MTTARRNGRPFDRAPKNADSDTMAKSSTSEIPPTRPSPFLLLAYPAVLGLGSVYSTISPTVTSPKPKPKPFTPGLSSDISTPMDSIPINYFADKRNILNLYFVKIGWFWTTIAFLLIALPQIPRVLDRRSRRTIAFLQSLLRYALVTTTWIATTQWFFGPALIDRSFTWTGGRCEALPELAQEKNMFQFETLLTAYACKRGRGMWTGGHDISGHIFMLVLSSAFLMLEIYLSDRYSQHPSITPKAAAGIAAETSDAEKRELGGWESLPQAEVRLWTRRLVKFAILLDWWMILMTAIFFHTWLEKVSGLLISSIVIYIIYFLPQFVPEWRSLVGGV